MLNEAKNTVFRSVFVETLKRVLDEPLFVPLLPYLTDEAQEKILLFVERLVAANRSLNLTAITDPVEMATKHVADSLTCLLAGEWPQGAQVCDVGTGGGFPGMVVAIVRPDLKVDLVDSVAKKLGFLAEAAEELGVQARTVHGRAEELGRKRPFREGYDVVVARAVARLPVLAELCLPLTKVEGWFVAMKGPAGNEELEEAGRALRLLGGSPQAVREIELPLNAGRRTLIVMRKEGSTPPSYPRRPGIPAKKPLV